MSCDQEPRNVELRCKVCSKIFDRRSRLESHRKIHSGDRPFSCPFCEKKFLSRGNCNTHIKVHTKERPYRCPYCNKSFSQNGQLTIHIRHHTGEKPFVCSYCSKGFSCSKVMKIHMRTHTGEKPFLCEFCNKGFAAYANLVVHKRIHTGERPYSCSLCGKCFEHSGNLRRHRKVHKVENGGFRCIPCGQVFEEENNLLNHSLKMHPNEYIKDEGDFNAQKELNKILPFSSDSQVTTTEENCTSINGKSEIEIMDHEENTNYSSNNSTSLSIESSESPGVQVSSSVDDLQNSEAMRSNSHKGNINSQNSSHSPEGINPLTIKIKLPKKKFRKRNLKTCHNSVDILGGKITEVRKNSLINISSSYTIQSIDENSSALDTLANIANQSEKIDTAVKNPCETKETLRYSDVCVELLPNKSNKRNHELNISSGHKSEPCNKKITSIPSLIPIDSDKNFSIYNDEHLPRPAKFQKVNNEQLLTTLRKNIQSFIQNILPTMNLWSSFKEKVELILIALIGETNMEEFGYPKRTTEQVSMPPVQFGYVQLLTDEMCQAFYYIFNDKINGINILYL